LLFKCLLPLSLLIFCITTASAAIYIPVDDDLYDLLFRLEAEGYIQSGLLSTRPISRREASRLIEEAENNAADLSAYRREIDFYKRTLLDLPETDYAKVPEKIYLEYLNASADPGPVIYNREGDEYKIHSNARLGFSALAEFGNLSFFIDPELRYSGDNLDPVFERIYGVLHVKGIDLEIGKDSQWWGPGYHGALLLSNNAQGLSLIKITNADPVQLPSIFRYLGLFRFTFFASRLEEERFVPEPYLWGARFDFKPNPYLEVGLQRTALLGGDGRSEGLGTWWKSLTGKGENETGVEAGDQRAGLDLKITLPFRFQPAQIYYETAGEDEAGGLPSKWAYIAGIYLPRILHFDGVDFRAEYADNHILGSPNVWYTHDIYRSGYTYKGEIIGHHMGTDSDDLFMRMEYRLPEISSSIALSYDKERHNLSGSAKETKDEFLIGFRSFLKDNLRIGAEFKAWRIKGAENSGYENLLYIYQIFYL